MFSTVVYTIYLNVKYILLYECWENKETYMWNLYIYIYTYIYTYKHAYFNGVCKCTHYTLTKLFRLNIYSVDFTMKVLYHFLLFSM